MLFRHLLGVCLAVLSVLLGALVTFSFRWGLSLAREMPDGVCRGRSAASVELFGLMVGTLVPNVQAVPVNLLIGWASGETLVATGWQISQLGGMTAYAAAGVCWRMANLAARSLGVNTMVYLAPLLSVLVLFALGYVRVGSCEYSVVGAVGVMLANLMAAIDRWRWSLPS